MTDFLSTYLTSSTAESTFQLQAKQPSEKSSRFHKADHHIKCQLDMYSQSLLRISLG